MSPVRHVAMRRVTISVGEKGRLMKATPGPTPKGCIRDQLIDQRSIPHPEHRDIARTLQSVARLPCGTVAGSLVRHWQQARRDVRIVGGCAGTLDRFRTTSASRSDASRWSRAVARTSTALRLDTRGWHVKGQLLILAQSAKRAAGGSAQHHSTARLDVHADSSERLWHGQCMTWTPHRPMASCQGSWVYVADGAPLISASGKRQVHDLDSRATCGG